MPKAVGAKSMPAQCLDMWVQRLMLLRGARPLKPVGVKPMQCNTQICGCKAHVGAMPKVAGAKSMRAQCLDLRVQRLMLLRGARPHGLHATHHSILNPCDLFA